MNAMLDRLETSSQTPAPVRVRRVARAAQPARVDPHQPRGRAPQPRPHRLARGRGARPRRGRAHGGHGERAARPRPTRRAPDGTPIESLPEVDLDELVLDETVREHRVPIDTTRVSAGRVHGRREQLARVVRNLLDNADRHARTTVAVALHNDSDGTVELTVDDDGPGIPVEDRERVFDRFTRLDDGRARDAGGLGIGLSMVKAIVEQHGGTVVDRATPRSAAPGSPCASRRSERLPSRPCPTFTTRAASTRTRGAPAASQRRVRALRPRQPCCAASTPT